MGIGVQREGGLSMAQDPGERLGLMYTSKDQRVRDEVRQPASHSQRSIYAG